MSYSMTFKEMQDELDRLVVDTGNTRRTSAQKKDLLNRSSNKLISMWDDEGDVNVTTTAITTTGGTQEYNLPVDFLYTKQGMVYDSSDHTELYLVDYGDSYYRGSTTQTEEPTNFYIIGSYSKTTSGATTTTTYAKIGFFPTPDSAYTYTVRYIPISPPLLTADADVSPVPGNFHDLVVLDAAKHIAHECGLIDLMAAWMPEYVDRMREFNKAIRSRVRPSQPEFSSVF